MTVVGYSRSASPVDHPHLVCRPVNGPDELAEHHRIRAEIFVREQAIFPVSDVDVHDDDPSTVHVLGMVDGVPAGTVRLYPLPDPLGAGLWKGDRLAVLPAYRNAGIGRPLVRIAVGTAGERGGNRMIAQVQLPNRRYFEALGWSPAGPPANYLGVPHQQMTIALH